MGMIQSVVRLGYLQGNGSALRGKSNGGKIGHRATPIWGCRLKMEIRRASTSFLFGRQGEASSQNSRSAAMSAGLARNWWAIGLRALLAVVFVIRRPIGAQADARRTRRNVRRVYGG